MKLATSTGDFEGYFDSDLDKLRAVRAAGFRYVDFSFYSEAKKDSVFMSDGWESYVAAIGECAKAEGLAFVQSHLPGWNILDEHMDQDFYLRCLDRCLAACARLSIPTAVIHTGWKPGIAKDEYFERNAAYLRRLYPSMEKTGVRVLIENSTRANMGECYFFFTGSDMAEFLSYANHPLLGACWDTGHANIEGHQYEDLMALGSRYLWGIHFNDNRGASDEHIAPLFGTMSIDECMHGLLDAGYQGPFVFESNNIPLRGGSWPVYRRQYPQDTRCFQPSIALKRQAESLLFCIGQEILSAYHLQ